MGRALVLLKTEKLKNEIAIIRNDPHEAGLLGALHRTLACMFSSLIRPESGVEAGALHRSSRFNLPESLCRSIPRIGDYQSVIVMHNNAVVQGLSEAPFMKDVSRWANFIIGTGLGNALSRKRKPTNG
jgi:hypothetical protein